MARLYKNIEIWKLGYEFTLKIYRLLDELPETERDSIIPQMRRAALSIPLNITEGASKRSKKDFLNYVNTAYGSAKELDVLLSLCKDLKYINEKIYQEYFEDLDKLMAKIFLFMRDLEKDTPYKFFKPWEGK
jgi:four helix bundle protein